MQIIPRINWIQRVALELPGLAPTTALISASPHFAVETASLGLSVFVQTRAMRKRPDQQSSFLADRVIN
jgi:hypothetical protein